ncbi:MAG: hypothetical protein P8N31_12835 [Planctomycetota bacterium]|nr:hypothetical protein [Planctomycetota bacterium]MDG2144431.1 hypothetical protein [Planctomycetota bacterium]
MTNENDPSTELEEWELIAWRRLRAGMLVELGNADKKLAKTWQARVKSGDFDADLCTDQILATGPLKPAREEEAVLTRTTRLERDLLMTPLLKGVSGKSRKVRGAAKSGAAALIMQFIVVGIFCILTFLFLLVAAMKGVEFDPFFQAIIDFFPAIGD